jgi:hypothetical protein
MRRLTPQRPAFERKETTLRIAQDQLVCCCLVGREIESTECRERATTERLQLHARLCLERKSSLGKRR